MDIKDSICESIYQKKTEHLTQTLADKFNISRQGAQKHLKQLVDAGILRMSGSTKAAKYELVKIVDKHKHFDLSPDITEDFPWRTFVRPLLDNLPANIISICQYGFTEMFNNAIDHSGGSGVLVSVERTAYNIVLAVRDNGVGIFRKITHDFKLDDELHAILELSKGKLTSDPARHSGEGIFFTSRMFDRYIIMSGKLYFSHTLTDEDWLLEGSSPRKGTAVIMDIRISSDRTTQAIFNEFATVDHPGFYKTIVPVRLAQYGDENMISRSQAKRVMARVDKFREVMLDFEGVNEIGQAFADEIFRVFREANPQIHLIPINTNESVQWMINRATASGGSGFQI
jgi:anti-sigma regulatory factor (Ser/Thr protein kinase)